MNKFQITPNREFSKTAITRLVRAAGISVSKDYVIKAETPRQLELCADFARAGQLREIKNKPSCLSFDSLSDSVVSRSRQREINSKIRDLAYRTFDWGRKKNIHTGERHNSPDKAGMHVLSSYRGGWTRYDYYADYYLKINGHRVEWKLTNGDEGSAAITRLGGFVLDGVKYPARIDRGRRDGAIKPHHVRRMIKAHIPRFSKITVQVIGLRIVLTDPTGEKYHCSIEGIVTDKKARQCVRDAVRAFRKRRRELVALKESGMDKVFVSLEDSLSSGNCETDSKYFAHHIWKKIGATGECAVRADIVLAARNDNYTRRAVSAAMRHSQVSA